MINMHILRIQVHHEKMRQSSEIHPTYKVCPKDILFRSVFDHLLNPELCLTFKLLTFVKLQKLIYELGVGGYVVGQWGNFCLLLFEYRIPYTALYYWLGECVLPLLYYLYVYCCVYSCPPDVYNHYLLNTSLIAVLV